ncbi:MAG: TetR/AcrR family transcriptional regulator [Corynebacterium sp.]|nr:TetR/AcrR family transcriptional regulator [Corynebacterium sp.]
MEQGKRAAARVDKLERIIKAAERQIEQLGPHHLSLRGIAAELNLRPSAIYRYYNGIDDIYTAAIIRAYHAQTAAAQAELDRHTTPTTWAEAKATTLAIVSAVRTWALENPHRYELIYGTPIRGYAAPRDTIAAAAGVGQVLAQPLRYLTGGDTLDPLDTLPEPVVTFWLAVYGHISFELFGHLEGVINNKDEFFHNSMDRNLELLRQSYL